MTRKQILELLKVISKGEETMPSLVETHVSWVLLTGQFAYKIKKPIRFSFLDFSTLAKRKRICEDEVRLNSRLTDIYLGIVPVTLLNGHPSFYPEGKILDYAVKMIRLDSDRQMHLLLEKNAVKEADIEKLAIMIASFHLTANIVRRPFNLQSTLDDFADIRSVANFLDERLGNNLAGEIDYWIKLAEKTLHHLCKRFEQRVGEGFIKDGHGDLHSGNIFLLENPVIFDCIEFNPHFRENDVLSELAFLAMDLEQFNQPALKDNLMRKYQENYPCILCQEDDVIFNYYLLYRASVRLKIIALKWRGMINDGKKDDLEEKKSSYPLVELCKNYAEKLKQSLEV